MMTPNMTNAPHTLTDAQLTAANANPNCYWFVIAGVWLVNCEGTPLHRFENIEAARAFFVHPDVDAMIDAINGYDARVESYYRVTVDGVEVEGLFIDHEEE